MSFHEVQFPTTISFGSFGGPERRTEIVTLSNGYEERSTPWAHSKRRYDAGLGMRSLDDIADLIAFFEARAGRLHGFRWKDWGDFKSCLPSQEIGFNDQVIGIGDGQQREFALSKSYISGEGRYARPICKPVIGSVVAAIQGEPQFETRHFELDSSSGLLKFLTPPASGLDVTAGFEFDVPVRFDTDIIETSLAHFEAGELPRVPVIELRL
jgi:uncharacterized protein (TIGR02217 family)